MEYRIWDRQETLYDDKRAYTPDEVIATWAPYLINPAAKLIIADMPIQLMAAMEFEATKELYRREGAEFTDDMTDQEALDVISAWEDSAKQASIEAAKIAASTPSADERIAAALEFNNLLLL